MSNSLLQKFKLLGPGILFAGAAIGASHIIQSTQAGANFGFSLLVFVILANLFKYPFFEFGHRYTVATGESLISGYKKIGNWALNIYIFLNIFTSVISTAGVTIVTSAILALILQIFFGASINLTILSIVILSINLLILFLGKYSTMDKVVKFLVLFLTFATTFSFIIALFKGMHITEGFVEPDLLNMASIGSLITLMGWMPAPIEASSWSSIWILESNKESDSNYNMKSTLFDFNVGYIITTILACVFLGLGAFVMYGTGKTFSNSSVAFISQIIELYTSNLGKWSTPIISLIAFATMFSTTITVIDAYPRTLNESYKLYLKEDTPKNSNKRHWILTIVISTLAIIIISFFTKNLKLMVDFATIISFVVAPFFAFLNYKLVLSKHIPAEFKPNIYLKVLSVLGIIFLILFSIIYLYSLVVV